MTATTKLDAFATVALAEKEARKKLLQRKSNLERKEVRLKLELKKKLANTVQAADQTAATLVQTTKAEIKSRIEKQMVALGREVATDEKQARNKWQEAKALLQKELQSLLH